MVSHEIELLCSFTLLHSAFTGATQKGDISMIPVQRTSGAHPILVADVTEAVTNMTSQMNRLGQRMLICAAPGQCVVMPDGLMHSSLSPHLSLLEQCGFFPPTIVHSPADIAQDGRRLDVLKRVSGLIERPNFLDPFSWACPLPHELAQRIGRTPPISHANARILNCKAELQDALNKGPGMGPRGFILEDASHDNAGALINTHFQQWGCETMIAKPAGAASGKLQVKLQAEEWSIDQLEKLGGKGQVVIQEWIPHYCDWSIQCQAIWDDQGHLAIQPGIMTRQILNKSTSGTEHVGNIGWFPTNMITKPELEKLVMFLVEFIGTRGNVLPGTTLGFGVDIVLNGNDVTLIEINFRWTAPMHVMHVIDVLVAHQPRLTRNFPAFFANQGFALRPEITLDKLVTVIGKDELFSPEKGQGWVPHFFDPEAGMWGAIIFGKWRGERTRLHERLTQRAKALEPELTTT